MMSKKPCDLTVKQAISEITSGKLPVLQLVESCLERIADVEDKIQAWARVDRDGALEKAQLLDQELELGKQRGPLHGIPFGIKDIFYTAGLRTEAGFSAWSGFVPSYDATSVARLREAGAIILGKTHTTQFAYMDPAPTRNPWNTDHTPGGSSSGSGTGVAAGTCLAALGSQTLGSVLRPAAFNGIVGFKPHYGRISTYGVVPLAWTLDHVGILAHTVEDVALIFQTLTSYDPMDCHSLDEAVPDCLSNLESQKAPRLGLVRQYFYDNADEEMQSHTDDIVERLQQSGAEVQEIELLCNFSKILDNGRTIMAVEAATYHQTMYIKHKDQYRTEMSKLIEQGLSISAIEYARALELRLQQYASVNPLLYQVDALLIPGAVGAAPHGLASTGNPVMQGPWTIMGVPTISLPTGLNMEGLPLAVQLVGHPKTEDHLLTTAQWCERVLNVQLQLPIGY